MHRAPGKPILLTLLSRDPCGAVRSITRELEPNACLDAARSAIAQARIDERVEGAMLSISLSDCWQWFAWTLEQGRQSVSEEPAPAVGLSNGARCVEA